MANLFTSTLKKGLVAAVFAASFAAPGAEAQYYYQPAPRYYPAPQYYPQPYPPQYQDGYTYRRRAPQGASSVCVTSRGNCNLRRYVRIPSGCFCNFPGFGRKAGYVGGVGG